MGIDSIGGNDTDLANENEETIIHLSDELGELSIPTWIGETFNLMLIMLILLIGITFKYAYPIGFYAF